MSNKASPIKEINKFDPAPFKAAEKEVDEFIKKKNIDLKSESVLSQGQSEIFAALQHTDFPNEKWSMVQPYIHMEYAGLFGTSASFQHEQATIFKGLENPEYKNTFEKLFFSTKQEREENPLDSMKGYFADRNVIAAVKDLTVITNTISEPMMAQRKISLSFDIFDINALSATQDSPPEEKFLRALLTLGTSFKLYFGYPPGSMKVDFPSNQYFIKNYNDHFSERPYYEMMITNSGIPDISIDQKGNLQVKVDFLETSSSYIKGGKNSQAILQEGGSTYRTTFNEIEKFIAEVQTAYNKNNDNLNFGEIINIIFEGNNGSGYYKLPIDPSSPLTIEYSKANPLAGMMADTELYKFRVPVSIFCNKVLSDKKDFEVTEEQSNKEKKKDPYYMPPYYPLSRLLSLLIQITFENDIIYYLGQSANCSCLTFNINKVTDKFKDAYEGKRITNKKGELIGREGGLKPKVDAAIKDVYGGSLTRVRMVYTLVGHKLYFLDLHRRLYLMFESASEKTVAEMSANQGKDYSYLPIVYLNHENTLVSNFNLSMIENSELMNRTAGIILNDSYFGSAYTANNRNLFYAEILMRQGSLEMKGMPFVEPYTGISIVGPAPLNRILGNYLITGVTHTINQNSFKTTLDVLGIEVYGVQKFDKNSAIKKN